jgi:hypothetical protein
MQILLSIFVSVAFASTGCCPSASYMSNLNGQANTGVELMKHCEGGSKQACDEAQNTFQAIADTTKTIMEK